MIVSTVLLANSAPQVKSSVQNQPMKAVDSIAVTKARREQAQGSPSMLKERDFVD